MPSLAQHAAWGFGGVYVDEGDVLAGVEAPHGQDDVVVPRMSIDATSVSRP